MSPFIFIYTLIDFINNDLNKKAIKKAQGKGDYVFVSTGRPYALIDKNIFKFVLFIKEISLTLKLCPFII